MFLRPLLDLRSDEVRRNESSDSLVDEGRCSVGDSRLGIKILGEKLGGKNEGVGHFMECCIHPLLVVLSLNICDEKSIVVYDSHDRPPLI